MDRAQVSAIASKGGKAAHAAGTAHRFTREEAQAAGRKGGAAHHERRGRAPRQTSIEYDEGPVTQRAPVAADAAANPV